MQINKITNLSLWFSLWPHLVYSLLCAFNGKQEIGKIKFKYILFHEHIFLEK